MLVRTHSYVIKGIDACAVTVEVDIRKGLPSFTILGCSDHFVRETRERIRAALLNEGFDFPQRRVIVNVAPHIPDGSASPALDLAIAAGILGASGQVEPTTIEDAAFIGELSLDGRVRAVRGAVVVAEAAKFDELRLFLPADNGAEAELAGNLTYATVQRLSEVADVANTADVMATSATPAGGDGSTESGPDIRDLRGHASSIRALEIAAAGGHHLLLVGTPGCGKTMLARRLPSILPVMSSDEAIEVARPASISGQPLGEGLSYRRPFRAPHHSCSTSGLIGGGGNSTPGEVSRASNGVLFLDDLAEFARRSLEALREPLERGCISLTRNSRSLTFPARFQLIGAINPCPCGAGEQRCRCSDAEIGRFRRRLSNPICDYFDMQTTVTRPTPAEVEDGPTTDSATIRARVEAARAMQRDRYAASAHLGVTVNCNGQLDGAMTRRMLAPSKASRDVLNDAYRRNALTLRGYDRVIRVARTIADLAGESEITDAAIREALAYQVMPDLVVPSDESD